MYYSGRYFYQNPSRQPKIEVKPVEYAHEDEINNLKRIIEQHDIDIKHCLPAINANRKDCEQMYQAIDMLKYDVQQVEMAINYLHDRIEFASNVAKRKRRVTICANGQKIEVRRHD